MTTTTFAPSPLAPFQLQPTLDGAIYNLTVTWNLFGQRWYVNINAAAGTLVVAEALVDSAPAVGLTSLSWANGSVSVVTSGSHGYLIGATCWLTIAGCVPSAYNGSFLVYIVDAQTFTYALVQNPGPTTSVGSVSFPISMTAGHFASTMTFDQGSQTFTVLP